MSFKMDERSAEVASSPLQKNAGSDLNRSRIQFTGLMSGEDKVRGRRAAIAITFQIERDSLSIIKFVDPCAF